LANRRLRSQEPIELAGLYSSTQLHIITEQFRHFQGQIHFARVAQGSLTNCKIEVPSEQRECPSTVEAIGMAQGLVRARRQRHLLP